MKYDYGFIAIGDEIADGDITNTNTPEFAKILIEKGFEVGFHISCKDDLEDISESLSFLEKSHKNIVIVGGLGPTEDDLTSQAVAKHFKTELVLDEESWLILEKRMLDKYGKITHGTRKQALFPKSAEVLKNLTGTANGFKFEFTKNRKVFVFPGPPRECIPMFKNALESKQIKKRIIRKSWNIYNIGESFLAEILEEIKLEYSFVTFKYRLDSGFIELKYFYPYNCPHSDNIIKKTESLLKDHIKE
jgi:molybdenum cofactor synthesis domain-containing protein